MGLIEPFQNFLGTPPLVYVASFSVFTIDLVWDSFAYFPKVV